MTLLKAFHFENPGQSKWENNLFVIEEVLFYPFASRQQHISEFFESVLTIISNQSLKESNAAQSLRDLRPIQSKSVLLHFIKTKALAWFFWIFWNSTLRLTLIAL